MKDLLRQLKLVDKMTVVLPINSMEFANRLAEITQNRGTGLFSNPIAYFSSSNCEYIGKVDYNSFRISRRPRFFNPNMNSSVANGTFREKDGELIIETEINGFNDFYYFYYGFLVVFYLITIIVVIFNANLDFLIVIPFFLFQSILLVILPFFAMKASVKRLKYELEREFFYLSKLK